MWRFNFIGVGLRSRPDQLRAVLQSHRLPDNQGSGDEREGPGRCLHRPEIKQSSLEVHPPVDGVHRQRFVFAQNR